MVGAGATSIGLGSSGGGGTPLFLRRDRTPKRIIITTTATISIRFMESPHTCFPFVSNTLLSPHRRGRNTARCCLFPDYYLSPHSVNDSRKNFRYGQSYRFVAPEKPMFPPRAYFLA